MRAAVLAVALALPALAEPPGAGAFVAANREAWLSKKKPGGAPAVDAGGRMAIGQDGDLLSAFVAASNPAAAAAGDRRKLLAAMRALESWAAPRREAADRLLADAEALVAEAEGWKGDPPAARLATIGAEGDDELATASRNLAAAKGKAVAEAAAAYAGALRRWRSLDAWLALTLRWIEEDGRRALDYEQAHHDTLPADTSILFLAGGEHIVRSKNDLAALQRLAEDLLKCDPAERGALRSPPHALPPSLDDAWAALLKACGDADVEALLAAALDDRWNGAVVAHQLWKYSGAKATARLGAVLKAWKTLGGKDATGLLEVMNYRQGSVFSSSDAADRFQEGFDSFQAPPGRREAFAAAQATVSGWVNAWSYEHQETLADCFANRKYDCFNVGSLFASLLANRGHDGIYPVMQVMDLRHVQTAMRIGDAVEIRDGAGTGPAAWPAGYAHDPIRMGILWRRTVDSWVDAEILDCSARTLTRRRVPYYGVEEETTGPVAK